MIERFAQLPQSLRASARWERLGPSGIPVMLVHPDWNRAKPAPVVLWMHGRTANKELDPGRYLRWMRAEGGGIGACAIDLPGHGERINLGGPPLHDSSSTLDVVRQMIDEIDEIVDALATWSVFDMQRIAIGGMSAGGMAALARLCKSHPFRCASVEATTGSWESHFTEFRSTQGISQSLQADDAAAIHDLNPITHLQTWREIPFQAIHTKADEWVSIQGQAEFIEALRQRYDDPSVIEFIQYESTGAPGEHIGFGRMAADAKDRQRDFFRRWLQVKAESNR